MLSMASDQSHAKHRYQSAELINGRTAMTAVAGILIPSILTHAGLIDLPAWYEAGKINDANNGWDWSASLLTSNTTPASDITALRHVMLP